MNAAKNKKRRASLGEGKSSSAVPGPSPVGGDLSGSTILATVVGIQGNPVDAAVPSGGDTLIFDASTGEYVPAKDTKYFISGAAAALAAPHINGTFVIITPTPATVDSGTWQVTADQGAAFPADYTKVSDHTNTASELGVLDTHDHFDGTNAEAVLDNIAEGQLRGAKTPLTLAATLYVVGSALKATYWGGDWSIVLTKGSLTYKTVMSVAHDGAIVEFTESNVAVGPGIGVLPVALAADIVGTLLRITAQASEVGWSCHARCLDAMEA